MKHIFLIFLVLFFSCNPQESQNNTSENEPYEISPVRPKLYDSLTLAADVKATVLDTAMWPYFFVHENGNFITTVNPHLLSGDKNSDKAESPFQLHGLQLTLPIGFQTGICSAPWGDLIIAAMPDENGNRFAKGHLYAVKNGELTKIATAGMSTFTSVLALQNKDGRAVIYYTDQSSNMSFLYKWVADSGTNLQSGKVYVANVNGGFWVPLEKNSNAVLNSTFKTPSDLLANLNKAATLTGTPMPDPLSAITLDQSNNSLLVGSMPQQDKNRLFGAVYTLFEANGDYTGLYCKVQPLVLGGLHLNFTHPYQLATDSKQNVWILSGMSDKDVEAEKYAVFGGNALMVMPRQGIQSKLLLRLAVAPGGGRFCGIVPDVKNAAVYTWLRTADGRGQLLRLTGKAIDTLLK